MESSTTEKTSTHRHRMVLIFHAIDSPGGRSQAASVPLPQTRRSQNHLKSPPVLAAKRSRTPWEIASPDPSVKIPQTHISASRRSTASMGGLSCSIRRQQPDQRELERWFRHGMTRRFGLQLAGRVSFQLRPHLSFKPKYRHSLFDRKLESWKAGYMKTTIDLPEDLVREMKFRAVREGRKLRDVAEEVFRRGLAVPPVSSGSGERRRVSLPIIPTPAGAKPFDLSGDRFLELEMEAESANPGS